MPGDIRGFLQQYLHQQQQPNFSFGQPLAGQQPSPQQPPPYADPGMMGGQYSQLAQLLGTGQSAGAGGIGSLLSNMPMNKYNGNARGSVIPGQPPIGGALGGRMQIPTPVNRMQAQGFPMGLLGYGGK